MVGQKNKNKNVGCFVVVILAISIFAIIGFYTDENSTNTSSQSAQPAHEDKADKTEAIIMAEKFVKDRLVSQALRNFHGGPARQRQ